MGNCWGDSSVECRDTPPYPSSASTPPPASTNHKHHTHDVKQGLPQPPRKVSSDAAGGGHHQNGGTYRQNGSRETSPSSTASGCAGNNSNRPILPSLKIFSLADLRIATRNFRPDIMLGEGGFGRVFKGWVDENTYAPSKAGVGIPVAVKKSSPDSPQGLQEWQAEVKFLGKYSHQNLVKLIGYCWEDKQYLLVYEYMQRGSLEDHLFKKGAEPLDWRTRLKIAIGAARGLAFLHTSEKSVIYRDFKASNILLDGEFNAKLSDFGLAKLGPADGDSHVTTRIMGTYGYAAPEYMATGHLYINSDVYGFGVVLLELLTGLQALDLNRPGSQHNLIKWAKPALSDKRKLKKIMDPRLENVYPSKAATQLAGLVLTCLEGDPRKRPSMEAVLVTLEKAALIKPTPKEIRSQSEHPASPGATDEHSSSHYHHHRHYHRHHRQHRFPVNGRDAGPSSTRSL